MTISNKNIYEYCFEEILEFVSPRITFHCNNNKHKVNGYDFDDLYQELSFKLWSIYDKRKIPEDMCLDRRFNNYLNMVFYNEVNMLFRRTINCYKYKATKEIEYRDRLNECSPLEDYYSDIK